MCNLSQYIWDEGYSEGYREGFDIGIFEGKIKVTLFNVKELMKNCDMSEADAMDILDIENDIRPIILERCKNQSHKK